MSNHSITAEVAEAVVNSWFPRSGEGNTPSARETKAVRYNATTNLCFFTDTEQIPAVTRSTTSLRRSPRIEAARKHVHFQNPRPIIRRADTNKLRLHVSPSPPLSPDITRIPAARGWKPPHGGGEMNQDPELMKLPRTFPIQDVGIPTPSTTNLNEPP